MHRYTAPATAAVALCSPPARSPSPAPAGTTCPMPVTSRPLTRRTRPVGIFDNLTSSGTLIRVSLNDTTSATLTAAPRWPATPARPAT